MKQKYNIIFLAVLSAVFSCVQVDEGMLDEGGAAEKVEMTFTAVIDAEDADTKTVLDGKLGDGTRKVLWQPSDVIAVTASTHFDAGYPSVEKFTAAITEESASAKFEGTISFASEYRAFYPYQTELRDSMGYYVFKMPQVQKYVEESFDPNSAPMTAVAKPGETLQFKNLCGILALRLSGDEAVKKITFIGRDEAGNAMPVSGTFEARPSADGAPELKVLKGVPSVTLECASDVSLGASSSVPFYFVLPPATYSSFLVMIETKDGKIMLKEGKNPLTIRRSDVQPTAALQYVETVYIDLSERGTANSYIVPKAGLYTFDADVIGNGEFGIVEGANFHTSNTAITPTSVEVLWEDREGILTGVTLKDGKISFMSTGLEGNALVAAKNASGQILWSWHIWVTDQPADHVYVNDRGTFTMLDRNLGATRADRGAGEEWRESAGFRYQWGRKDPFRQEGYNRLGVQLTLDETVLYPTSYITNYDQWMSELNQNLWSTSQKTIYDPCPVGYRTPVTDVWRGFTTNGENADRISKINASGTFDHGWNFVYDESGNTAWYPTTNDTNIWGDWYESDVQAYLWSANSNESQNPYAYYFNFYYNIYSDNPDFDCWVRFKDHQHGMGNALAVRCMKDEGHVDTSYPTVKITSISEVSSTGAKVTANVSDEGISAVTERGFVYGTAEDINVDNADKISVGSGSGEFTVDLTSLNHSTRYYVKAYARNERGVSYSKAMSFFTPYEGSAVNLSKDGTANCYIVPPVYSEYAFNASVKGNSDESVGSIAEAVVLWETRNTSTTIEKGDVIESVSFDGNNVHFFLPAEPVPGNALIAVKDALGTILWSWHIWVVDFDPVKNGQVYIGGSMMMDRNLGALSVIPAESMSGDYGAYGLYYQWGRKDPAPLHGNIIPSDVVTWYNVPGYNTLDESIWNPTTFAADIDWNTSDKWSISKTMYDPCPYGWRVAEPGVWEGINNEIFTNCGNLYRIIPEPYSVPAAYCPMGGEYYSVWPGFNSFNDYGSWWTSSYSDRAVRIHWSDTFYWEHGMNSSFGLSVRCMKDADFSVKTGTATNIKGTSADVAGSVTVNDATVFEAVGFIYVDNMMANPTNAIRHSHDGVIDVNLGTKPGDFKTTLTGLKPNTTYKVRAYAKGGYNLRYGDEIFITTPSAGNGEGFDDGGDYEWE